MTWQTWQTILSILGAAGGACGLGSLWYSRRQVVLVERQIAQQNALDQEELHWSERFERLANQLARLTPSLMIADPERNSSTLCLYPAIFPDPQFRRSLESYIVQPNASFTQFSQRNPRPDELRRTNMRETIIRAEKYIADFQKSNPKINLTYYLG